MSLATDRQTGPLTLVAPAAGRVRLHAPGALCGEIEVFREGETIATVGTERVEAPGDGFLLHSFVADGVAVEEESPLVVFSVIAP